MCYSVEVSNFLDCDFNLLDKGDIFACFLYSSIMHVNKDQSL